MYVTRKFSKLPEGTNLKKAKRRTNKILKEAPDLVLQKPSEGEVLVLGYKTWNLDDYPGRGYRFESTEGLNEKATVLVPVPVPTDDEF